MYRMSKQSSWGTNDFDFKSFLQAPTDQNKCGADVAPPGNQFSCNDQKNWGKCSEAWMKGYCCRDIHKGISYYSCGNCNCGGGNAGGSGGNVVPSTGPVFLGINLAWKQWGRDFDDFDTSYIAKKKKMYFSTFFSDLKQRGLNIARVWMH